MTPCARPADLPGDAIAHPDPFLLQFTIDATQVGTTVAHVSNVAYVAWLDRAAELHADALGFPRERLLAERMMWFVGRHEVDYRAEVFEHDELVLATWVRDIRRIKSWRDTVVYRPADQRVVCTAATLWVLVDLESRSPRRFTDEMHSAFAPLHGARRDATARGTPKVH